MWNVHSFQKDMNLLDHVKGLPIRNWGRPLTCKKCSIRVDEGAILLENEETVPEGDDCMSCVICPPCAFSSMALPEERPVVGQER